MKFDMELQFSEWPEDSSAVENVGFVVNEVTCNLFERIFQSSCIYSSSWGIEENEFECKENGYHSSSSNSSVNSIGMKKFKSREESPLRMK